MLIASPTPMEAAAISSLSKSPDWKAMADYMNRAMREVDLQLRACTPDRLGRLQGAAVTLDDIVKLPDVCREILKQRT